MKEKMKSLFKNKYFVVCLCFFMYILLLEETNFFTLMGYKMKVHDLKGQAAYYEDQLIETKISLTELTTDDEALERFAREQHYMKRENEDVFVFVEE
jgi:cell division protein FtsB